MNGDRCRTVLTFINVLGINAPFYNLLTTKNAQPFMPNLSAVKLAKRGSRISKALFRFAFTLSTRAMLLSRSETYIYTKSEDVTIYKPALRPAVIKGFLTATSICLGELLLHFLIRKPR